ncbi:hypothetical protein PVAND_011318 [Polypedilum vanderplanki]|uniref:Uncharacterized protein n=1 Tax=Polypedilum vanderplanki TaxID=319348 RepID=A0A9J6CI69_POLVA|nr:hypothetical protein PVAND_011318 [Polypedilum vanderplanki]
MIQMLIHLLFVTFVTAAQFCIFDTENPTTCSFRDITDSTHLFRILSNNPVTSNIKKIYFQRTTLTHLPKELTIAYTALDELDASYVYLWRFTNIDFAQTTKFKKLNMSHNQIHRVSSFASNGMINLENLDLSHNMIQSIDNDGIVYNENLKYLNLSDNRIGKLDRNFFKNIRSVKILNLSNNKISSLSCETCDFEMSFEEFYLQNNQLISFNPDFIKSTFIFDVSNNAITGEIDFSNSKLIELNIRGNALQYLTINDDLEMLDASDNTERSFDISFGNNKKLISLALANLDIVHYENIFAGLHQFEKLLNLDLSENNLEFFDLKAHNLPQSLQTFNLRRTDLHSLLNWKSLYSILPNLKEINIVDNYFSCSELPSILESLQEFNVNISGLSAANDKNKFVQQNCAADSHRKRNHSKGACVQKSSNNTILWILLIICLSGYFIGAVIYANKVYNFIEKFKSINVPSMTVSPNNQSRNLIEEQDEV